MSSLDALDSCQPPDSLDRGGEAERPKWEPVDWADLKAGDKVQLSAFDMQEGWQRETRTVLGRDGETLRMHCPACYSNGSEGFDYDYTPSEDRDLARRKPKRLADCTDQPAPKEEESADA